MASPEAAKNRSQPWKHLCQVQPQSASEDDQSRLNMRKTQTWADPTNNLVADVHVNIIAT